MVRNTTIWTVQVFWGHPAVWRLIVKHKENITDNADNKYSIFVQYKWNQQSIIFEIV